MSAEVEIHSVFDIGLKLPDATEIFPPEDFRGRMFADAEGRNTVLEALRVAGKNMGYPDGRVLDDYKWIRREKQIITITREMGSELIALDDPVIVTPPVRSEVANSEPYDPPVVGWG